MVNELLGIQYNIAKANRTDRKVQNLAAYINADTLRAIHKTMDRKKRMGLIKRIPHMERYRQTVLRLRQQRRIYSRHCMHFLMKN